jgi:hypothetical protein
VYVLSESKLKFKRNVISVINANVNVNENVVKCKGSYKLE